MPSPGTNVDVLLRCINAISNRDIATLKELSTPDVEVRPLRAILEDTIYYGHDGADQWLLDITETWAELTLEVHEITEPGPGSVSAFVTIHGRGHGSDAPTQMRVELRAQLKDGLVRRAGVFPTG